MDFNKMMMKVSRNPAFQVVKDFQGYFTRRGRHTVALFESKDCIDWYPSEIPFRILAMEQYNIPMHTLIKDLFTLKH